MDLVDNINGYYIYGYLIIGYYIYGLSVMD